MSRGRKSVPLAQRFWSKVDRSGGPDACWPWLAGKSGDGYGSVWAFGQMMPAPRVAWILTFGSIPDGFHILHHCDNPSCNNPFRCLFLGTNADNKLDSMLKRRNRSGYSERFSDDLVLQMRRLATQGWTHQKIADHFNLNRRAVTGVVSREFYRYVSEV